MPSFQLEPVTLGDFVSPAPDHYAFTVVSALAPHELWAGLHAEVPLAWCTGITTARWTSTAPYGVGTTRRVTLATGVQLSERYIRWVETPTAYENVFTVDEANLPLFRRFGERCTVTAQGPGSAFTWEFIIEPRTPAVARPLARRLVRRDLERIRRDTVRRFAATGAP